MAQNPRPTLVVVTEFRALSRQHLAEISETYKDYSRLLDSELSVAGRLGILRTDIAPKYIRLALLNTLNWTPRWFRSSGSLSYTDLSSIYNGIFWEGVISPELHEAHSLPPLPTSTSRQRSHPSHRGTLGKFIRGAAELFSKHGYESTTTRDLATLLGMERATLYYHVEGKEDLLYAICKSSIEQLANDVREATEGISDPLAQLQVGIQTHVVSLLRDQTQHREHAKGVPGERAIGPGSRTTSRVYPWGHLQQISRHDARRAAGSHRGLVQAEWRPQPLGTGRNSMPLVPRRCAASLRTLTGRARLKIELIA
jgi:AcrR family transcriptional regulator